MLKKKVEEFGQQSKNLDSKKRRLEHFAETLKDPNDVSECIITLLYLLNLSKEKIDQVISVVLRKLAKKDTETSRAVGVIVRAWSMQKTLVTWSDNNRQCCL